MIFKYSLVIFVSIGFWLAIFFQFLYYRFLHPSDHVRLNTKRNVSSLVHIRPISRADHLKRSKSCDAMIENRDIIRIEDILDKTSLNFDSSADRFAKENRQKLLLQQKTIDQRVKLTRVQEEAMKRHQTSSTSLLSKISNPLKRPTTISTRTHFDSISIDENAQRTNEMILTTTNLSSDRTFC